MLHQQPAAEACLLVELDMGLAHQGPGLQQRHVVWQPQRAAADADIEQAKQALIANVLQKPTDFYAEASLYTREFWQGKYAFDARDRYLAALNKVTKADVVRIYEKLIVNEKAGKTLLQLRGTNFKDKPFAKAN
jgi:protease-3